MLRTPPPLTTKQKQKPGAWTSTSGTPSSQQEQGESFPISATSPSAGKPKNKKRARRRNRWVTAAKTYAASRHDGTTTIPRKRQGDPNFTTPPIGGIPSSDENGKILLPNSPVSSADQRSRTLDEVGRFHSSSGKEYVKQKEPRAKKIDQLNFSARLTYGTMDLKLHNEGGLMAADNNYVTKVIIERSDLLRKAERFDEAKDILLRQLRIVKVLIDDKVVERNTLRMQLLSKIERVMTKSAVDLSDANACMHFCQIVDNLGRQRSVTYRSLCDEIKRNRLVSNELVQAAQVLFDSEHSILRRDKLLSRFGVQLECESEELYHRLEQFRIECAERHRSTLQDNSPSHLRDLMNSVCPRRIMMITCNDVKLFTDLGGIMKEEMYQKPLEDLATRWIERVRTTKIDEFEVVPQINPINFFLCKSLEELIVEIGGKTEMKAAELLTSDAHGWYPAKTIVWKAENVLTKCLEREYYFIFKLLKHFELGSTTTRKSFEYTIKLLNGKESRSSWATVWSRAKQFFGFNGTLENPFGIADEFYVWYCLLDDALTFALPDLSEKLGTDLDMFGHIIQNYIDLLCEANQDRLETIRVITHNTVHFIVQTVPVLMTLEGSSPVDRQILQQQLNVINSKALKITLSSNVFRDLVDVFNDYWTKKNEIVAKIPSKTYHPKMEQLKDSLLATVLLALKKDVQTKELILFFRGYSDLLVDLNDVQFDWFIKSIPNVDMEALTDQATIMPVNNKWVETDNRTFLVTDTNKFSQSYQSKHYVIEIVATLLSFINQQLQKTEWIGGKCLVEFDQLTSTNELMFAVRNSLLYLKEQPNYVSFEQFFEESVKPFSSAIENSSSRQDFTTRIYLIKESFWYIRKQNEMSIAEALDLFWGLNVQLDDIQLLRKAYQRYSDQFEQHMQTFIGEEHLTRAFSIATKVKENIKPMHFSKWDSKVKEEIVPDVLAGLAAAWSILVSKDVSSTGKYLSPHCVQIICILRLLSVDQAEPGVAKHLAQVLTGQGKSLVLGLTAALLALMGHKVHTVCYNRHLVERDYADFYVFFNLFNIGKDIVYKTFNKMANDLIAPTIGDQKIGLRDLVTDLVCKQETVLRSKLVAENLKSSILLIDEVDVFFTKEFYGNMYCPVAKPLIPGLDKIQERIWNTVTEKSYDIDALECDIIAFISSSEFEKREQFHSFITKENKYKLFDEYSSKLVEYTNQSLFDEHLRIMIECAINVEKYPEIHDKTHKLSDKGSITFKKLEEYANHHISSYYTTFNYLRLKKQDFIPKTGYETNYGYLMLMCGSISYAMLPINFPLIIGVTGTLTALNQYENRSIKDLYGINASSIMPTFFGCSNLQFDQTLNFQQLPSKSSWMKEIFSSAQSILLGQRSVLIFFEDDAVLNYFHREYSAQLDRLNVLTENTKPEQQQQFANEAGVSRTITLATRGMGRGVDYKSSVAVEKNGGVHVIQTFFSLDVKEETQIKGRTARKDNMGSYELIVCIEDLSKSGLLACDTDVTYACLDSARSKITLEECKEITERIAVNTSAHDLTMKYLMSFFRI